MLRLLSAAAIFLLMSGAFASGAAGQSIVIAKPKLIVQTTKTFPIQIVGRRDFCTRMSDGFSNLAQGKGLNHKSSSMFGHNATSSIIGEFRRGRATDYLNVVALEQLAPDKDLRLDQAANGFLPLSDHIARAMGIAKPVHLVLAASELRYVPFSQQNMALVVIADNAAAITPDRARRVAAVSKSRNLAIHVVWVGIESMTESDSEARALAYLSAMTGGTFVDLSGNENPCSSAL